MRNIPSIFLHADNPKTRIIMMKPLMASLFVLLPLVQLEAQREYLPTPEDLTRFHNTKTYVVLSDNLMSEYNFEIRDAIERFWTITGYEFLDYKNFAEKSLDYNASFLYVATVSFEKDKSNTRYIFLCLSLGGEDHETLDDLKDITNIPLSYYGVDEDEYTYKLGILVRFMQQHIKIITDDPKLVSQTVFQYYNDNMGSVKEKILYMTEEDLPYTLASESKIRAIYPYDFQIVEREKIKELIMAEDENAVILHKVGPQSKEIEDRVYKILMGTGDARFYYYDYHKSNSKNPDAFLKSDFERLSRAVPK
jgi:hypothetical protein